MQVLVIGGGAAGLCCALRLRQLDPTVSVTVLERLEQPGKKLLATGNGRCNLTNAHAPHSRQVLQFFASLGLMTRQEEQGRVYPYSLRAATVLHLLLHACRKLGVHLVTGCRVERIIPGFTVQTDKGTFTGDRVVVACGGQAQPALGSDGSGYQLLRALGHTTTPLYPALVQLTSSSKYPRKLKGQRTRAAVTLTVNGKPAAESRGEVLFTDYGLSGIAIMDVSWAAGQNFARLEPQKCCVILDLIPEWDESRLLAYLRQFGSLRGILSAEVTEILERQAAGDPVRLVHIAKHWQLIVTGTKGYAFAQITGGGVPGGELEGFASRRVPGLYIVGEVLDVQQPCGGYNLNFAFYSGLAAAEQIVEKQNDTSK